MRLSRNNEEQALRDAARPREGLLPALLVSGVFVVLALLVWQLADVLLLLFGGIIVATALRTLAAPLVHWARVSERVAVLFVVVLFVAAIAVFISLVGDRLSDQIADLRRSLPDAFAALVRWLRSHPGGQGVLDMWEGAKQGDVPWARVVNVASTTLGALGGTALVIFVGIYLAVDPRLYRRGLLRLVPPHYRGPIHDAMETSGESLSKWLMGQSVSMLFVGTATAIGLFALGMPLAFSLGVISGVLAFVPFFGALASGVRETGTMGITDLRDRHDRRRCPKREGRQISIDPQAPRCVTRGSASPFDHAHRRKRFTVGCVLDSNLQ